MIASQKGHVEVVKSLLSDPKIEVNIQNNVSGWYSILLSWITIIMFVDVRMVGLL